MGTYDTYHAKGEAGPRIDTLDSSGTVVSSFTFTNVASASILGNTTVAPQFWDWYEEEKIIRTKNDGSLIKESGGFRYKAKMAFKWLDKANAGYITSILNHAVPGTQLVRLYPRSDVTTIYYDGYIEGHVGDAEVGDSPVAMGHRAELFFTAQVPLRNQPWPISYGLTCIDSTLWGAYSAAEKQNTQLCDTTVWSTYSTAEKTTNLGYAQDTSEPIIID